MVVVGKRYVYFLLSMRELDAPEITYIYTRSKLHLVFQPVILLVVLFSETKPRN